MESIHVSELRAMVITARGVVDGMLDEVINEIDTKILVGNIHVPAEKKPRKKRTRKVKVAEFPAPKEETSLPDADVSNPFYTKKKREKKIDGGE